MSFEWAKEKRPYVLTIGCAWYSVRNLKNFIDQDDNARTFVWCRSNEIYKDDCLKKTSKFFMAFMILGGI